LREPNTKSPLRLIKHREQRHDNYSKQTDRDHDLDERESGTAVS